MGDRAVLVETDSVTEHVAGWSASMLPGVTELVPAAATVLVLFDGISPGTVADWLRATAPIPGEEATGDLVRIDVRYDGPDIEFVAAETGLDVATAHTGRIWTAAFCGFAPGFAYLVADDAFPSLSVPRLSSPRTAVPAGSVALAGGYSAVYPSASPGGWRIIGSTDAPMWDIRRDPPALLTPGSRVQFRAVT